MKIFKKANYRNRYFEFYPHWGFHISFETYSYFGSYPQIHFQIIFGSFYIKLKRLIDLFYSFIEEPRNIMVDEAESPMYGIYYYENSVWFKLGNKCKSYDMPWCKTWISTSTLKKDGTWYVEIKKKRLEIDRKTDNLIWNETHPYKYITKNDDIQIVNAHLIVVERLWKPKWFKWTSLFDTKRRVIDIEFSDEIGEKKGSWKGGCIGCSYEMLPNETPLETLRRMEIERKFT